MLARPRVPDALVVSGDDRIQKLLAQEGTVVTPAYACIPDGFVNDTTTPYANASIYRPDVVCKAGLVSTLQYPQLRVEGSYYFGFTMYTTAGHDEPIQIWIGHRQVALARISDPDNRLHLFVAPGKFTFRGGEIKRLITSETDGPCRIENIVFLPKRPRPTAPRLEIRSPHVDVRHADGGARAYLTWTTNRPCSGQLRWGSGRVLSKRVRVSGPLANHEVVLDRLDLRRRYRFELRMVDQTGKLEATASGDFKTNLSPPKSRTRKGRLPLLLRRASPGAGSWPVSVGVPFPRGALGSADQVRLLGKGRAEIPAQVQTLARWEDGSVRWALLDFQADGQHDCTVEYGREVTRTVPEETLEVAQSRTGITVTTGPIRVEFPKATAVLPGIVSHRQPDGSYRCLTPDSPAPAVILTAGDGAVYRSGKPDAVVLEEPGPERVCVRIDLTHRARRKALFRSTFRVHLFRNSPAIRLLHTFENDRTEEAFTRIRDLSLRIDLDVGEAPEGRIGRRKTGPLNGRPILLQQTHDNRYAVAQGRRTIARGKRADGRIDLLGKEAGATLVVRDFWQNYPKGLGLDGQGITVQVCPPLKRDAYPKGGELEDRLYYYLLDGRYKLKCGVSRTHELWLQVGQGAAPADFEAAVQSPPLYSVSLETFNRSRAVIQLPPKEESPYPPYEEWVEAARQAYAEDRVESRAYGMLNYGDWYGERTYNWGNMEYDTPWCFLHEYLRNGHPDFYTWAEEAARHLVDVDTRHSGSDPKSSGEQYIHSVGHVGDYYPEGYRERAIFAGRWSVSHTWVEGLFLYHLLTGDARILKSAMATCDLLVGKMLNDYDFTVCRNCGWHLIHLAAAYTATGRRVYLNAARIIVDRVLERQRPSGGWDRLMAGGHCNCYPPRHTGNAGFMVGILVAGLKRFYDATGDRRVAEAIVRAGDYLIDSMWVPEKSAFRYTSCPNSSVSNTGGMRAIGVSTAYHFVKKKRFEKVLRAITQTAIAESRPTARRGIGKGICSPMWGTLQIIADLPKGSRKKR